MPRRLRKDHPGAWHHVMSRGIARRTVFENRRDVRYFLSRLARCVRSGDLEVLAYSILTTHFHLLVRSPRGRLSSAMQRALDAYARWFNRGRRRDGPLFRGRFVNRLVETGSYAYAVLRYIDRNPVEAGLVTNSVDYPHGSAWHYVHAGGPSWLHRSPVESMVRRVDGAPWDPEDYRRFAEEGLEEAERWIVERRLADSSRRGEDPLDDLLDAAPGEVRRWMVRKAALADGTEPGWPVAAPAKLQAAVRRRRSGAPDSLVGHGRRKVPFWGVVEAGLLRTCSGLRQREIASRMGLGTSTIQQRLRLFGEADRWEPTILTEAASVLEEALKDSHGRKRLVTDYGPSRIPSAPPCRAGEPSVPRVATR